MPKILDDNALRRLIEAARLQFVQRESNAEPPCGFRITRATRVDGHLHQLNGAVNVAG